MKLALVIVAVILFLLSAIPTNPWASTMRGLGLASFAGSLVTL